jgi:general secretion pathway protein M
MKAVFAPWWRDLSRREQWLVAIAAVLAIIVMVWLVVLRPLHAARAQAEARYAAASLALADVAAAGKRIRIAEARGRNNSAMPLVELVSDRVLAAGLTVESMTTSGDGQVSLRIPAVRPALILRWIADIERNDGMLVEQVAIIRNDDATVAVDLVLRRGAR